PMDAACRATCSEDLEVVPSFISWPVRSASQVCCADSLRLPERTATLTVTLGIEPYGTMVTCSPLGNENFSMCGRRNGLGGPPAGGDCLPFCENAAATRNRLRSAGIRMSIYAFVI